MDGGPTQDEENVPDLRFAVYTMFNSTGSSRSLMSTSDFLPSISVNDLMQHSNEARIELHTYNSEEGRLANINLVRAKAS